MGFPSSKYFRKLGWVKLCILINKDIDHLNNNQVLTERFLKQIVLQWRSFLQQWISVHFSTCKCGFFLVAQRSRYPVWRLYCRTCTGQNMLENYFLCPFLRSRNNVSSSYGYKVIHSCPFLLCNVDLWTKASCFCPVIIWTENLSTLANIPCLCELPLQ